MPGSSAKGFLVALGLGIGLAGPALARERAVAPAGDLLPCPSQGAGFVRVPGTTTCLRLSGRVAAGLAADRRTTAPLSMGRLSIDTRTATEYGPVRGFVRMGTGRP
ncbi:porin [Methylobacterium sp. J-090]|uniref:porin n=1 Tax=Methylobacterium sp. J-090 TaxID=2836666 RepID=UPI001FBB4E81|nr:porin [Methylobacterium sp. J-090]MCJ2083266.1 porin [Methylobacterium sp. J-090]